MELTNIDSQRDPWGENFNFENGDVKDVWGYCGSHLQNEKKIFEAQEKISLGFFSTCKFWSLSQFFLNYNW